MTGEWKCSKIVMMAVEFWDTLKFPELCIKFLGYVLQLSKYYRNYSQLYKPMVNESTC